MLCEFYYANAFLDPLGADNNIFPIVIKNAGQLVALLTIEKNSDALTVTAPMGAIAQEHRGSGLAALGPVILETVGRLSGAELAYYFATLKALHQQLLAERNGYALVGIVPAYDRDMVESGKIVRVYEAISAKVLATRERVLVPPKESLTPKTKKLFDFLFSDFP